MKLNDIVDVKTIQKIQDQFSEATGLAIVTVDLDGNYITKESNFTDFYKKYVEKEGLYDKEGVYVNSNGLGQFSFDMVYEGEKIAKMVGGQVLTREPYLDDFREKAKELGVNETEYINAVKKLPIRSESSIKAAASFLEMTVNRVMNSDI